MLDRLVQWLLQSLLHLGYPGITALMALESSVVPVPAELVMPPAGYWVAKGEMHFLPALGCGVLGSVLGALASYAVAHWLGRGLVRRFGKYVLVSERSLERSERYFAEHGEISVFLARLVPVLRHLISIPAGLARMSLPRFVLYTAVGAGIWCAILTEIGYVLGQSEGVLQNEEVRRYVGRILAVVLPLMVLVVVLYVVRYRRRMRAQPEA
ncbi:MAG TPA: DedA family protein [Gemmatimonadales bacterium]|nr:DedA family protein [Gemmatimonadales bacterium]